MHAVGQVSGIFPVRYVRWRADSQARTPCAILVCRHSDGAGSHVPEHTSSAGECRASAGRSVVARRLARRSVQSRMDELLRLRARPAARHRRRHGGRHRRGVLSRLVEHLAKARFDSAPAFTVARSGNKCAFARNVALRKTRELTVAMRKLHAEFRVPFFCSDLPALGPFLPAQCPLTMKSETLSSCFLPVSIMSKTFIW